MVGSRTRSRVRVARDITQKYYIEHLLPVYVSAIQEVRLRDPQPWILQEDNDQAHGTKDAKGVQSLATQYKEANWINTIS